MQQPPTHELPDGLRDIVKGINDEPVPVRLSESVRANWSRRPTRPADPQPPRQRRFAVAVTAFTVIAMLGLFHFSSNNRDSDSITGNHVADESSHQRTTTRHADLAPSLWNYHRATADSIESVDELLARHAVSVLPGETAIPSVSFPRREVRIEEDF